MIEEEDFTGRKCSEVEENQTVVPLQLFKGTFGRVHGVELMLFYSFTKSSRKVDPDSQVEERCCKYRNLNWEDGG